MPVDPDRIASVLGHSMIRQVALEQQLEAAQRRIAELEGERDANLT